MSDHVRNPKDRFYARCGSYQLVLQVITYVPFSLILDLQYLQEIWLEFPTDGQLVLLFQIPSPKSMKTKLNVENCKQPVCYSESSVCLQTYIS